MHAYKPRESLLYLFDPLSTPDSKTPSRNTGSPESLQSSDKENDGPAPGEVTTFFNRVYKIPNVSNSPKGKLIDFEDASFDDEDDEENDENADAFPASPSLSRRPLADLEVEKAPPQGVSVPQTIYEEREQPVASSRASRDPFARSGVTAAPSGAPLANVINSINLSPMSITDQPTNAAHTHGMDTLDFPNITVHPPEAEPESPASRATPAQSPPGPYLSPESVPTASSATRRPSPRSSSFDPRRTSVDLQSSFSMHLQSSEMSFDLLNDKISFLSNPQESFLRGLADADAEDDTFDLAKEQMQIEEIAKKYLQPGSKSLDEDTFDLTKEKQKMEALVKKYGSIQEQSLETVVEEVPRVKELTPPKPRPTIQRTLEEQPPVFSLPSSPVTQAPAAPTKAVRTQKHAPESKHSIPPVPALNLVKKTFNLTHDRTSSTSSTTSTFSSASRPTSSTSNHTDSEESAPGAVPRRRPSLVGRPPVRGVQRPPPGSVIPPVPTRTAGPVRSVAAPKRTELSIKAEFAVASRPSARTTSSASTTRLSGVQRPTVASATTSTSRPSLRGTTSQPKVAPSALRPPTRLPSTTTSSSTSTARSALPRPASRLPGPKSSNVARRL